MADMIALVPFCWLQKQHQHLGMKPYQQFPLGLFGLERIVPQRGYDCSLEGRSQGLHPRDCASPDRLGMHQFERIQPTSTTPTTPKVHRYLVAHNRVLQTSEGHGSVSQLHGSERESNGQTVASKVKEGGQVSTWVFICSSPTTVTLAMTSSSS